MDRRPKVFIVILNWNGKEETTTCLKSIQELRIANYESTTLVVDNASSDDSVKALRKLIVHDSKLKILVNKSNLGFSGGNNVGVRYALEKDADYVLLLNNDTLIAPELILRFIEAADKYPEAGILSPKIYFAPGFEFHKEAYEKSDWGKVIWYAGGKIDWKNVYGMNIGVDAVDKGQFASVSEIDFATGACMFVRKEVFEKIGLFDERYFMYFEDGDFSLRAKKAGWKVLYTPEAYLWHKVARSSGIGSELNDYFLTRNRMIFGMKYASLRTKIALARESIKLLLIGREWQKIGIRDFYSRKFGIGSWSSRGG